jgi:RNA polymerase sigma-70 factor (ECF subfamily)
MLAAPNYSRGDVAARREQTQVDRTGNLIHRYPVVWKAIEPVAGSADAAPQTTERRPDELFGLARAAASGDASAAATLVTQVGGTILSTVRQVLGRQNADADDIAQEATMSFLASLPNFRGESSTRRYAQRVALFAALSARRRAVARQRLLESDPVSEALVECERGGPLNDVMASRRREVLRGVLDTLPDVIAEALALHFIAGYTVEEIAAATQSPANTIWSRLRLGKKALRRAVKRDPRLVDLFGSLE